MQKLFKKLEVLFVTVLCAMMLITACGKKEDSSVEPEVSQDVNVEGDTTDSSDEGTDNTNAEDGSDSEDATPAIDVEALKEQMGFYVDGTTLYDANGNPFILRGVNHSHTWFTSQLETSLDAIADTGCNSVRIVLSNGAQWSMNSAKDVEKIIDYCKEKKMVAVLEVHDATGYTDTESLIACAQYFVFIKDVLIGEEDYVIINIANEWGGERSKIWAEAYTEAIGMLREAGLSHTIMIDCCGWGQYAKCIKEKGEEVLAADPLENVMFSIHMYGTAGGTDDKIKKNLEYATSRDLCVCVGEFGYTHTDGDVDEGYLMQYCVDNAIGYMAWSWKGNGGGVEYLDLATEWDGSVLSPDWGEVFINGTNGIKETSVMCSVFEE